MLGDAGRSGQGALSPPAHNETLVVVCGDRAAGRWGQSWTSPAAAVSSTHNGGSMVNWNQDHEGEDGEWEGGRARMWTPYERAVERAKMGYVRDACENRS